MAHIAYPADTCLPGAVGLTLHTLLTPACQVLWDCCVRCAGFPMLGEALLLIMARASDQEDSMRKQAAALCSELWFTPGSALPGRRKRNVLVRLPALRTAAPTVCTVKFWGLVELQGDGFRSRQQDTHRCSAIRETTHVVAAAAARCGT